MSEPLAAQYEPRQVEPLVLKQWDEGGCFQARPEGAAARMTYTIVIPPPNVTGALHLGHAINNTLQDILIRRQRMMGADTLWLPGTDHAGIATQAVVERKLLEEEGKTRHDVGREALIERIWAWKEEFGGRILRQLRLMGCSCDWSRTRFTLDEVCAKAVRQTFFRMFRDGLITRGLRLVNWDAQLRTAVSDDEIYHETVQGHLWHYWYPIAETDERLLIATTRPETMLGDTAVAVHPEDERYKHLIGKKAILPLTDRRIPIISDPILVDPTFGTGCVKVTPAHDPNDYECALRNNLEMINILNPDGTINANGGRFEGMDRYAARKEVVAALEAEGLMEKIEDYEVELGHSDRSKTPIEPYLSEQWFVKTAELAQAAMNAVKDGRVRFHPDRYARSYLDWLAEKRDWCISRQLWWGHRIPVWSRDAGGKDLDWLTQNDPEHLCIQTESSPLDPNAPLHVCPRSDDETLIKRLEAAGFVRDPDVLDTWFSSALWPHSTLGWPEETTELKRYYPTSILVTSRDIITLWVARMVMTGLYNMNDVPFPDVYIHVKIMDGQGQTMSKSKGNGVDPVDVIEQYGADALRFSMAYMATETQDVRMPVEYKCPHCGCLIPQTPKNMTVTQLECPDCKKPMATRWAKPDRQKELGLAHLTSDKFEIGRNFSNKLWNAVRFALINLEGARFTPLNAASLPLEDRWILSRLSQLVRQTDEQLDRYAFAAGITTIRDFFWGEVCDWYLEIVKPRLWTAGGTKEPDPTAQQVLATLIDHLLRLLHPFVPFITEHLFARLNETVPHRGIEQPQADSPALCVASWPKTEEAWLDEEARRQMELIQESIRAVRDLRSRHNVPPSKKLPLSIAAPEAVGESLRAAEPLLERLAHVELKDVQPKLSPGPDAAVAVISQAELFLHGAVDTKKERQQLQKQTQQTTARLEGIRRKLSNENFLSKAPPDVVARQRELFDELTAQLATLESRLTEL